MSLLNVVGLRAPKTSRRPDEVVECCILVTGDFGVGEGLRRCTHPGEIVTEQRPASRLGAVPPRVWLALVLLVLAVVFILQNRQDAVIQLFMIVVTAPLWITLVACTAIGILIGALIGRRRRKGR